jgi:hypothetical protein
LGCKRIPTNHAGRVRKALLPAVRVHPEVTELRQQVVVTHARDVQPQRPDAFGYAAPDVAVAQNPV